jgi:Cu/Ag efflux protein CusF
MLRIIPSSLPPIAACAAAVFLVSACADVPKYKKSSGKFDEWQSYEGANFKPMTGSVAAVDPVANTVTINHEKKSVVFPVTSITRIMHEGSDIPLAQLPLNQTVRYTVSEDGTQLLTIWYGQHAIAFHRPTAAAKAKNTLF